ncbi:hypothetical protein HNP84_008874 [Thermocatellispora tengchongensis]|uniref:Uncharacterized protein n=1 Tax=Thermocatellispora tengchongensis TaxID=1073253 RepID=A0A840PMU9_9ACTN|nr:SCO2521 family protein [Thermocatellispora tengchongensis]MBB5139111.1 hypothetical protein [Thermocatellispora tengchongensis]
MLIMGEVQTGLLRNLGELGEPKCREVLGLVSGEEPRTSMRPLPYAISPEQFTGVDCRLPGVSGARIRGTGTVAQHAVIVGGRVLQASAYATVVAGAADHRLPWSHYLARPGDIEVHGRPRWADMAEGFMAAEMPMDALNLSAIGGRLMAAVQESPHLDGKTPFKSTRTHLRWVLWRGEAGAPPLLLTLGKGSLRTLRLTGEPATDVTAFCEDLALHDWLLTTIQAIIQRALIGTAAPSQIAARLAPAIDHLMHLWMPGARVPDSYQHLWKELERRPGFSRQWASSVTRIRDQIAVNTLSLLSAAVMTESGHEPDGDISPHRGASQDDP